MKRKFIFCLLLCIGVATAFGQKSEVKVMGVPFGSTYEEFTSAFKEKGFSGNMMSYVKNDFVEIKFTDKPFALTKREAELLNNRMNVLSSSFKSRRTIEVILITNQKALKNIHYNSLIYKNITLDELVG